MAVADMHGVRPGDHALAAGRAGRNDHIVFRKIQCFKRAGHPRQHGTVQLGGKRQLLEIGGADIIILEPRRHVVFVIDEGIDGCIRENMVHTVHHAVCTGVCHQPVMHNGYLRLAVFILSPPLVGYWIFSSLTILPPNTVRNKILISSATVQFSMYQIS